MKPFRYLGVFILSFIGLYAVLLALSYLIYPLSANDAIDTARASNTIYATEPKYLLFNIDSLRMPTQRVLLMGSSNVREGFRPQQLKPLLGHVEIDNLAIGAGNIRELGQVVDLAYKKLPAAVWPRTTFVVGIWYGLFVSDASSWREGMTDLNVEQVRYGLYRASGRYMVEPQVPCFLMPAFEIALHPLLLASRMYDEAIITPADTIRVELLRFIGEAPLDLKIDDPNTFVLNAAQRQASLTFWRGYTAAENDWPNEPLKQFSNIAQFISSKGSKLVVLDLPLPSWHRQAIPQYRIYEQRKQAILDKIEKLPGVTYASLEDGFADEDFYDSAHPRPKVTWRWAQRAAVPIAKALGTSL